MCSIANISRAAYYKYKNKSTCKSNIMVDIIIDVFNKINQRVGYRSIKNQYGIIVNHKKVQSKMRENSLQSIVRPKRRKFLWNQKKQKKVYLAEILLQINQMKSMMYLSTVIDLYDNYPVAWNLSSSIDKQISLDSIKMLSKNWYI